MTRHNAFFVASLGHGIHHHCQMIGNSLNNYNNFRNPLKNEVRKVQKNQRSVVLILPKIYHERLGITREDLMRFSIHEDEYTGHEGMLMQKIGSGI